MPGRVPCMLLHPPAKLNRFLRITGRRADGLHLLQTAFELIDWCDELEVLPRRDGVIERVGGLAGVAAEDDLVVRAARALLPLAPEGSGCTLRLRKSIPSGAGLGGGSSDAAAVLLALDEVWGLRLPLTRLMEIGLALGADVPVFLGQQPAFAEGVGERLTPLPFEPRHYAIIWPGVGLATGPMFAHPALRRDCPPVPVSACVADRVNENVFEPVAAALAPEVARALAFLRARFGQARLTGSGSAVFAQAPDRAAAQAGLEGAPVNWSCRAASSVQNWFDKARDRAGK